LSPASITREGAPYALIVVGRLTGPHGLHGKVKVAPLSGDPSGLLAAKSIRVSGGTGAVAEREFVVVTAHRAGGCAVFSLAGIDSARAAGTLTGASVSMRRGDLPPLPEDEFYWEDLTGCAVVDPEGNPLGEVAAVEPGPAHDWLVVRCAGGEERLLPVVAAFLRSVDVPRRRVVASPPEGW
jgi:16S rRNA processing protein RimM